MDLGMGMQHGIITFPRISQRKVAGSACKLRRLGEGTHREEDVGMSPTRHCKPHHGGRR